MNNEYQKEINRLKQVGWGWFGATLVAWGLLLITWMTI